MNKYFNKKTEVFGIVFDSKAESIRYCELRMLEQVREISGLKLQPRFDFFLPVNNKPKKMFSYYADFEYIDKEGNYVVEDVKSEITAKNSTYRLKKKIVEAAHSITITEV